MNDEAHKNALNDDELAAVSGGTVSGGSTDDAGYSCSSCGRTFTGSQAYVMKVRDRSGNVIASKLRCPGCGSGDITPLSIFAR